MKETSTEQIDRSALRPEETECHHRAETALKNLWGNESTRAVRIDSSPEPMFVTVEDGELAFWSYNYTWECQERRPIDETHRSFNTVVDLLHSYVNDGYGVGTVSKDRVDTEKKPRGTTLGDYS